MPIPIKEANLLELEHDNISESGVGKFPKKAAPFARNTMSNARWKNSFKLEDSLAINAVATHASGEGKQDPNALYCAIPQIQMDGHQQKHE